MSIMKKWLSKREPWIFENSKIPVWLSKVSPIEINAINILCFVLFVLFSMGLFKVQEFSNGL